MSYKITKPENAILVHSGYIVVFGTSSPDLYFKDNCNVVESDSSLFGTSY